MRVHVCLWIDSYGGELTYATSFIDRQKARKWFLKAVEDCTDGAFESISQALHEAEVEFDNYIPRCMDAEADGIAIVKVIETED